MSERTDRVYLLRLTRGDAREPWLIVATDIATGDEYPFTDLDGLVEFLAERWRTHHLAPRGDRYAGHDRHDR